MIDFANITVTNVGNEQLPVQAQMEEINIAPPTAVVSETIIETPALVEPIVETPVTPVVAPTSSEFNPKEVFGEEYDSIDKIKEALTKTKELQGKVLQYDKPSLKDPYVASLTEWLDQGKSKEHHDLYYNSDPSKLSAADKVALQLQVESGLSLEKAVKLVNHKYKLGEEYDEEDPEVDIARTMLEMDANTATKVIEQIRAKAIAPIASFDYDAQVRTWEPHIVSAVDNFKEIEISSDLKYPVPASALAEAKAHIQGVLSSDGVEMDVKDPKQREIVQGIARDFIKARQTEDILKYARTEWEKKQIREKSNIPASDTTPPVVQKPGPSDWMKTMPKLDM